jgi:hypothetical protein
MTTREPVPGRVSLSEAPGFIPVAKTARELTSLNLLPAIVVGAACTWPSGRGWRGLRRVWLSNRPNYIIDCWAAWLFGIGAAVEIIIRMYFCGWDKDRLSVLDARGRDGRVREELAAGIMP